MNPSWLTLALRELKTSEVKGPGNNPRILEYNRETELCATEDSVPWCASFVCAMLEWSGVPSPQSARAKDFLHWGVAIGKPVLGCVVILQRGTNPNCGHVGFFMYETANTVALLGGNQDDTVCVKEFSKLLVLGYRAPEDEYWSPSNDTNESDPSYS